MQLKLIEKVLVGEVLKNFHAKDLEKLDTARIFKCSKGSDDLIKL